MALMYASGVFVPNEPERRCPTCRRIVRGYRGSCPYCGGDASGEPVEIEQGE